MHEIVKTWKSFEKEELSEKEALLEYPGNEFKQELIKEFSKDGSSLFTNPVIIMIYV